jgi:hypothetical protein
MREEFGHCTMLLAGESVSAGKFPYRGIPRLTAMLNSVFKELGQ